MTSGCFVCGDMEKSRPVLAVPRIKPGFEISKYSTAHTVPSKDIQMIRTYKILAVKKILTVNPKDPKISI